MNEPLISVILPIYNVEIYLPEAIASLRAQTHSNLEIILVDDGSPDKCGALCDAYAKEDARIKVIHQKNAGQGAARNAGIEIAQGDYITFVDSDDYIRQDMYEILLKNLLDFNADVSVCSSTSSQFDIKKGCVQVCNRNEAFCKLFRADDTCNVSCCNKLAKRALYTAEVRFGNGYGEDAIAAVALFLNAKKVVFTDERLYFYRIRPESSMTGGYTRAKAMTYDNEQIVLGLIQQNAPELMNQARAYVIESYRGLAADMIRCGAHKTHKDDFVRLRRFIRANFKFMPRGGLRLLYRRTDALLVSCAPIGLYRLFKTLTSHMRRTK